MTMVLKICAIIILDLQHEEDKAVRKFVNLIACTSTSSIPPPPQPGTSP